MKFTQLFVLVATSVALVHSIPNENIDESKLKNINWNDINLDNMDPSDLGDILRNIANNMPNSSETGLDKINWNDINLDNIDPNDLEDILKTINSNMPNSSETGLDKINWNDINLDSIDPNDLEDIINKTTGNITISDDSFSFNNSTDDTFDAISKACEIALDKYQECLIDNVEIKNGNTEYVCSVFNSEKCQKLYNEGSVIIPECQNIDSISKTLLDNAVKISQLFLSIKCSKDENGNYCPLNELTLLNDDDEDGFITFKNENALFEKALDNTCKSKKCTLIYTNAISGLKASENEINSLISLMDNMDKILPTKEKRQINDQDINTQDRILNQVENYLKSSNCTQYLAEVESGISNPSSSLRVALFISLGLLLFILI